MDRLSQAAIVTKLEKRLRHYGSWYRIRGKRLGREAG